MQSWIKWISLFLFVFSHPGPAASFPSGIHSHTARLLTCTGRFVLDPVTAEKMVYLAEYQEIHVQTVDEFPQMEGLPPAPAHNERVDKIDWVEQRKAGNYYKIEVGLLPGDTPYVVVDFGFDAFQKTFIGILSFTEGSWADLVAGRRVVAVYSDLGAEWIWKLRLQTPDEYLPTIATVVQALYRQVGANNFGVGDATTRSHKPFGEARFVFEDKRLDFTGAGIESIYDLRVIEHKIRRPK